MKPCLSSQSASPVQEHVQDDLLDNDEYLDTGCQMLGTRRTCEETYQDHNGHIIVPAPSLEDISTTIEPENRRGDAEEEGYVCDRVGQWLYCCPHHDDVADSVADSRQSVLALGFRGDSWAKYIYITGTYQFAGLIFLSKIPRLKTHPHASFARGFLRVDM
jgi:hypothetical protein